MNSENSKTSESHILIFDLTDKLDLRRGEKSKDICKYDRKQNYIQN